MRLPPGDYCNGWLGMGDDKILGGGSIQMGLHGDNFLRHGACLVLSSPLDMGGFWRSAAAPPCQNLDRYPPPPPPPPGFRCLPSFLRLIETRIFNQTGVKCSSGVGEDRRVWTPYPQGSTPLLVDGNPSGLMVRRPLSVR